MAALAVSMLGTAADRSPSSETATLTMGPAVERSDRTLLVIVDGMTVREADEAAFLSQLPFRSVASVECSLPSSTAAITTWVTGRVPTLASFLRDFDRSPRRSGGLLQRLHDDGRPAFVAGPTLWTGRFGQWIDGVGDDGWGATDSDRLAAVRAAIGDGRSGLLVLHFDGLDRAGHLTPTAADATMRQIDRAIASIALRTGDRLLVVSDHGRMPGGGHAGSEPSVVRTPVLSTHPLGLPKATTQAEFAATLAASLDVPFPAAADHRVWPLPLGLAALAIVGLGMLVAPSRTVADGARLAIASGLTFLPLACGWPGFSLTTAVLVSMWCSGRGGRRPPRLWLPLLFGAVVATLRVAAPAAFAPTPATFPLIVAAVTIAAAYAAGRVRSPLALVLLVSAATAAIGQSASLSTIQTATGFDLAASLGLGFGIVATVALHAAPLIAIGLLTDWTRSATGLPAIAVGFAGTLAGLAAVAPTPIAIDASQLLLRTLCEAAIVGLAGGVAILGRSRLLVRIRRPVASVAAVATR